MCAIFGIIGEYDEKKAKASLSLLNHRGPDACGIVQDKGVFFAHKRLSIIDKHSRSNQPFKKGKTLLSFNGEIYNFKELKEQLSSEFEFQTQSDGEVILAAYLKWGKSFVSHLRGMFAIAILDGEKLYLFRDRLGKKPIFFMQTNSVFIFASELKALVPYLHKVEMDEDALISYLSFLAPTPPFTFFKSINKLGAGELLVYENHNFEVKPYFNLLDAKANMISDEEEVLQKIESKLEESISMRLNADTHSASLLSGGIDSATLNAFAMKNGVKLNTYTLGYKDFSKYDERQNAKCSAEFLGLSNKAVEISQDDFIDAMDIVLDTLDEPLNDPASVPLYLLFNEIKKDGVKVVMSGEGSDELFLGYRQYFEFLDIQSLSNLKNKNWLKRYFKTNFSNNREWEYYKRVFEESLLFRTSGENFTDLQKDMLLRRKIEDNHSLKYLQKYRELFEKSSHEDESMWYSYIDLHLFQAEHFLTKLDRVSMAHSIESRTPFLDHELVLLVFSISPELRYKDNRTKSLLKKIMQPHLSQDILHRKKKGFSNPYMEYLLDSKRISLIQEVNKQSGLFKEDILSRYIKGARSGAFKQHIWALYSLSHWIKKHLL